MSDKSLIRQSKPRNYLLVEGKDDEHVFYSLLKHYQVPQHFEIKNKESVTRLLETLDVELAQSDLETLGIVVDADTDVTARWQSLQNILRGSGYRTVPAKPDSNGTVVREEGRPVVGIWLMPNNVIPGMLEDFVSVLVPPGDLLWPIAEDTVQQVIAKDRRFSMALRSKALIHTWLAWQEEPGKPMGLAITARYLDATAPYAQQLVAWIRRLFNLEIV